MNSPKINRRDWLKAGTLLAGGLTLGSFPAYSERKNINGSIKFEPESAISREKPVLKARLFANENPFGPSDKAKEVLLEQIEKSFRYPFFEIETLKEKIAAKEGVKPENIMISAGSTEILLAAAMMFSSKESKILTADITYLDLLNMAESHGAEIDEVPLTEDLDFNLEEMKARANSGHSLVYLVNPNNPTGKSLDAEALRSFCNAISTDIPVLIDEAYIDFKENVDANSMVSCVREGKNVIVTRTFSKLHAFAGLRLGYAIGLPETIEKLTTYTCGGRTISGPTLNAALASYEDEKFLEYSKSEIIKSRDFLYQTLDDAGYSYVKSDANFVLFPLKYMKAERFQEEMFKMQVGIRKWSFRDKEWCRVSMGTMEEMKFFAKAFEKLS